MSGAVKQAEEVEAGDDTPVSFSLSISISFISVMLFLIFTKIISLLFYLFSS